MEIIHTSGTQLSRKQKRENYADIVKEMLIAYQKLECRMSLKIHFLHSHLNFFPDKLGDVYDEHGERFHHDISDIEIRCEGKPNNKMMDNYCWYLQRESDALLRRKVRSQKHFKVYSCTFGYAIHWLFHSALQKRNLTTCIGGMKGF